MKGITLIIVAIVIVVLGFLIVYSQTGIPKGAEKPKAKAAGYGAGVTTPITPMLPYVSLPPGPGDEKIPEGANLHLLVQPDDLEKNLGKWIVVDCRPKDLYDEGHIPTAIHLGESCMSFFRGDLEIKGVGIIADQGIEKVEELEIRLGKAGISNRGTIVFYGGIFDPFVAFWFMEYLGHRDVRVLDGGIKGWIAAGKPLETKPNKLPSTTFKAEVVPSRLATTEEVLKIAKREKDGQIVDNRSPDEYLGKVPAPPNHPLEGKIKRAGHIPNTVLNLPHIFLFQDLEGPTLRPIYQLKRLYQGLDKDKRTVSLCFLGNRSSQSYFVMRLLGFKEPANYYGGWIVWGNDEGLPIEKGH